MSECPTNQRIIKGRFEDIDPVVIASQLRQVFIFIVIFVVRNSNGRKFDHLELSGFIKSEGCGFFPDNVRQNRIKRRSTLIKIVVCGKNKFVFVLPITQLERTIGHYIFRISPMVPEFFDNVFSLRKGNHKGGDAGKINHRLFQTYF